VASLADAGGMDPSEALLEKARSQLGEILPAIRGLGEKRRRVGVEESGREARSGLQFRRSQG
jgi:hypothetical protein